MPGPWVFLRNFSSYDSVIIPLPAGVTDVLVSDEEAYELRRASVTVGSGEDKKFLRLAVTTP